MVRKIEPEGNCAAFSHLGVGRRGLSYTNLAVDQLLQSHSGRMVALQNGQYTTVPVDTCTQGQKRVDVGELYDCSCTSLKG